MKLKIMLFFFLFLIILQVKSQSTANSDSTYLIINEKIQNKDYESAWKTYQQFEKTYLEKKLTKDSSFAKASLRIAQSYLFSNRNEDSRIHYKKALSYLKTDDALRPIYLLQTYLGLGIVYKRASVLDTAIIYYDDAKSLAISHFGPEDRTLHNIYNNLGNTYRILGNFDKAIQNHEKALSIRKKHYPDSFRIGDSYNNLGLIYTDLKQFSKSRIYYQEALKYYKSEGNSIRLRAAKANYNISRIFHDLSEFEKSLSYVDPAILLMEEIDQEKDFFYAEMLTLKTNLLIELGRLDQAEELLNRATALKSSYLKPDHLNWAFTYTSAAYLARQKLDFEGQMDYLLKTLRVNQSHYPSHHPEITEVYSQLIENALLRKDQGAAELYLDSLELTTSKDIGGLNDKLAIRKIFQKAMLSKFKYEKSGNDGNLYKAIELITEAIDKDEALKKFGLEEKSQILLTSSHRYLSDQAVQLCFEAYQKTGDSSYALKALTIADNVKSQLLSGAIKYKGNISFSNIPQDIIHKEELLKETLNETREAFFSTENNSTSYIEKYDSVANQITSYHEQLEHDFPKYYNYLYKTDNWDIEQLSTFSAKENSIFISYYICNNDLFIFRIDQSGLKFYRQKAPSTQSVLLLRHEIATQQKLQLRKSSISLYEDLLENIIDHNDIGKALIIVGDQHINTLSFEMLIPSFAKKEYLLTSFPISYAYSLEIWVLQNKIRSKSSKHSLLAIAPDYRNRFDTLDLTDELQTSEQIMQRLPGSLKSVDKITEITKGKVIKGEQATKSFFLLNASEYNILHFSMHGINDPEDPLSSGLVFQPTKDMTDNNLSAREIFRMDLSSELAVLSACNTGWGAYDSSEGLNSLGYAFSYAGVPSTIMSLWQVPDDATSRIMTKFYAHLNNGEKKNEALRQAKLDYLETVVDPMQKNPFYWAGFVLNGNVNQVKFSHRTWVYKLLAGLAILGFAVSFYSRRARRNSSSIHHS